MKRGESVKGLSSKTKKIIAVIAGIAVLLSVGLIVYAVATDHDDDSAVNKFVPAEVEIAVQENTDDNSKETSKFENNITWIPEGDMYKATKQVQVTNPDDSKDTDGENTTKAYIRVALVPRWKVQVTTVQGASTADYSEYSLGKMPEEITKITYTYNVEAVESTDSTGSGSGSSSSGGSVDRKVTFTLASNWSTNWIYKDGYFYYKKPVAPGETTSILLESVSVGQSFYNEFANTNGCDFQVDVLADSIQAEDGAVDTRREGITVRDGELTTENTN